MTVGQFVDECAASGGDLLEFQEFTGMYLLIRP
jgi:hypothetical protein